MKSQLTVLSLLLAVISTNGQGINELYREKNYTSKSDTLPYRIMYPKNFNPNKKYPLVIFLHGSGERGDDNQMQLTHGATLFARDSVQEKFPAIVVFPQCKASSYWSNVIINEENGGTRSFEFINGGAPTHSMKMLINLVKHLSKEKYVDDERIYLGGLSMGGMGTFELLSRMPNVFAAAIPICGGGNPVPTKKYAQKVKIWIFHGEQDNVVSPEYSKIMAKAIKENGGDVRLTLYPNANHNSWDSAFAEPELLPWLFSIKKK